MKFEFTEQEANLILGALSKQPFEIVVQLINTIHTQAQEQNKPPAAEPEVKKK